MSTTDIMTLEWHNLKGCDRRWSSTEWQGDGGIRRQ